MRVDPRPSRRPWCLVESSQSGRPQAPPYDARLAAGHYYDRDSVAATYDLSRTLWHSEAWADLQDTHVFVGTLNAYSSRYPSRGGYLERKYFKIPTRTWVS